MPLLPLNSQLMSVSCGPGIMAGEPALKIVQPLEPLLLLLLLPPGTSLTWSRHLCKGCWPASPRGIWYQPAPTALCHVIRSCAVWPCQPCNSRGALSANLRWWVLPWSFCACAASGQPHNEAANQNTKSVEVKTPCSWGPACPKGRGACRTGGSETTGVLLLPVEQEAQCTDVSSKSEDVV